MDGFDKGDRILVIGATNNASKLDKALVRSGRFDRQIIVSPPENAKARVDLLEFFLKGKKVSDNVDLDRLSRQMVGYTGADIESVVNEAGLISLAEGSGIISMEHLEEAFDKKILKGNRKKNQKESKDLEVVAYHEAGHAVASYLLGVDIARATIVGTTSGVGGMVVNSEEDTCFVTDESLKHRVMIMYGGRCSERIKFGNVTNGASNDISQATNVLKMYVGKYGFDKDTGLLDVEMLVKDNLTTSDNMLMKMAELSRELEEKTMNLLETNYAFVELIAQQLLEKETLGGEAIKELLDEVSVK
jgi:cell division protease FtsH